MSQGEQDGNKHRDELPDHSVYRHSHPSMTGFFHGPSAGRRQRLVMTQEHSQVPQRRGQQIP